MPLPRVAMYFAVSRSSSAKGLLASNFDVRHRWRGVRLMGRQAAGAEARLTATWDLTLEL
jgi:hypothetical protein